jgi:hypothetical protein
MRIYRRGIGYPVVIRYREEVLAAVRKPGGGIGWRHVPVRLGCVAMEVSAEPRPGSGEMRPAGRGSCYRCHQNHDTASASPEHDWMA